MSVGMMVLFPLNYVPWTSMQISSTNTTMKRSAFLDIYRGLAVLLMIVFHFCWDLRHFGFMDYSIYDPFWVYFRSLILTLFMSAIGWSTYLALTKKPSTQSASLKEIYRPFWKRDTKLFLSAAIISFATYLTVPNQWIYFGILHFIFVASLITRPLVKWPLVSASIGTSIITVFHLTDWLMFPNAFATIINYMPLPQRTLDIVFPFPWIGVVLIGPLLGYLKCHKCPTPENIVSYTLAFMGRYALPIYLVHQAVLFALVAAFKMVLEL